MKRNIIIQLFCCAILLSSCTSNNHTSKYAQQERLFIEGLENLGNYDIQEKSNIEFSKLLLDDTCTFYYDFPYVTDSTQIVNIAASDDGNVRIYSWNGQLGGTMIYWENVVQYKSDGKLLTFDGSIWRALNETDENEEGEIDYGCWTNSIYTFKRNDGQTIYVTESYFRSGSVDGYSSLDAFCISNGELKPIEDAFNGSSSIGTDYNIPSWYFLTDGKGWDWTFSFDKNTQTFYVPIAEDSEMVDQYDLYTFNGDKFVHAGRDGGYWLHPSIRKFERLMKLAQLGKYLIRIDQTAPGRLRYVSWSDTDDMTKKPDIIIENGKYDKEKDEFSFINGDHTYYIKTEEDKPKLVVMRKNEILLTTE